MSKPLQGGIAKAVWHGAKAAKLYETATLTKLTPGTRTPGNISGGTNPTSVAYPCAAFVEDYRPEDIAGTIITEQDRKVSIYAASIQGGVTPSVNDTITVESGTYTIMRIGRDPASALFICTARGAG